MSDHLLNNRSFLALWVGQTISELGGSIGAICNVLLVYQITGSKAAMSSLYLIYLIPSFILQLGIGPYIDQISRKKIMCFSQFIRGWVFLIPVICIFFGGVQIWSLYFIQLILGLLQPAYAPASLAILPTIVQTKHLTKANSYMDGTIRLMSFLGPSLGGVVLASIDLSWGYLFVSVFFLLSAFSLLFLREERSIPNISKDSWSKSIISGYQYFFSNRQLLWLGIFNAIVQFGVGVTMVINAPYILDELNGANLSYGLFTAGFPFGYFIGSLLVGRLGERRNRKRMMLGALILGGLSFVLISITKVLFLAIIIEVLSGICLPFFHTHNTVLYQRVVPNHMVGKVFSIRLLIIRTIMPLGVWFAGQFGDMLGVRTLYFMIGIFISFPAFIAMLLPYFRFLDETYSKQKNVL